MINVRSRLGYAERGGRLCTEPPHPWDVSSPRGGTRVQVSRSQRTRVWWRSPANRDGQLHERKRSRNDDEQGLVPSRRVGHLDVRSFKNERKSIVDNN